MSIIADNLRAMKARICECESLYARTPHSVFLLAVSKGQPMESIQQAIAAGQTAFGESYVQEALPKIAALAACPIEWHFIGPIQSNKTKKIAEHFAWAHSVSSRQIAERLNDQRPLHLPPLQICIQVNISAEITKSGVAPENVFALAECCWALPRLQLRGLMAISTYHADFAQQRDEFHRLFVLQQEWMDKNRKLDTLSMGMSDDMAAAIAEGSTMVRIGTGIFGSRIKKGGAYS